MRFEMRFTCLPHKVLLKRRKATCRLAPPWPEVKRYAWVRGDTCLDVWDDSSGLPVRACLYFSLKNLEGILDLRLQSLRVGGEEGVRLSVCRVWGSACEVRG